jgi:lipopolysaccharide export system protein LptA
MNRSALLVRLLLLALAASVPARAQAPAAPAAAPVPLQRTELEADWLEMKSTETETHVLCVGNVVLTATNMRLACDRLEIIATRIGGEEAEAIATLDKFKYLLATGNVRMQQDQREVTCERAEVKPLEEIVILTGEPVLIDRATDIVTTGEEIVLHRGQNSVSGRNIKISGPAIKDLGAGAADAPAGDAAPASPPAQP